MDDNKLLLNQKKTNVMLFGTRPKLNKVNMLGILLKWQDIERATKFTYYFRSVYRPVYDIEGARTIILG